MRGYIKGNEYFLPDLFSPLYEQIAVRYANFSNLVGFDDGSFDGAGWFTWYGRWGFFKFASLVYENLDHPTAVHTSGLVVSTAWPEYRFNSVKAAFGGSFTTQPGSVSLNPGYVGLDTPSLDGIALQLTVGLSVNTRQFSVGHDLHSILDVYTDSSGKGIGNIKEALTMVKEHKAGSLALGAKQRQYMSGSVMYKEKHPRSLSIINATWMVEGGIFRKWVSAGTVVYDHKAYSVCSYLPPRFYAQSGTKVALVLPAALLARFEQARVIGRLLPRFDASSPQNIKLFDKMKLGTGAALQLSASNPSSAVRAFVSRVQSCMRAPSSQFDTAYVVLLLTVNTFAQESWDDKRLKEYTMTPAVDLTKHQGIGMFVDGDGSGGTLVVRVVCGNTARDYAVPLTFVGRQWGKSKTANLCTAE